MAEQKRDYYEVLGVDKNADDAALKKAYREIAKHNHPDVKPGDAEAEKIFKEASEAYGVLSDPEKRRQYDQFGHAAFDGTGGAGGFDFSGMDFGDIFGDLFGDFFGGGFGGSSRRRNGPAKGANLRTSISITFEESIFGTDKEIDLNLKDECPKCHGSGARPGTSPENCTKCGGKGQIVYTTRTMFGEMRNVQSCPECQGTGRMIKDKCPDCKGTGYVTNRKTISISVPAGIDNGQNIRMREKGEPGINGGPRGDLLVEINVQRSPVFQRKDWDIFSTVPISYALAALGGEILVDTVDGRVAQKVAPGTQTDTRIRLRGKGVPSIRNKDMRGDHYVTLVIQTPDRLSQEAKELLMKFDELTGDSLHAVDRASAKVGDDNTDSPKGGGKKKKNKFFGKG